MAKKSSAKPRIAGMGRVTDIGDLNKQLAKSTMGPIKNLKNGERLTVRFLDDLDEIFHAKQHYTQKGGYEWCTGGEKQDPDLCDNCGDDDSQLYNRYLLNAVDKATGKVIIVQMTTGMAQDLKVYFANKGTIKDRDYELSRIGSGRDDTVYGVSPESPEKMNTSRFKKLDIEKVILAEAGLLDAEDAEPEEEPEPETSKKPKDGKKKKAKEMPVAVPPPAAKPVKRTVMRKKTK